MIRVWIVAPSSLARAGLENLLASRRISIVGTSADLDSQGGRILDHEPDAVVVDGSDAGAGALLEELLESDLPAEIPVIVLRDRPRPEWTSEALRSGVRAILPSAASSEQLAAALQAAVAGLVILHPAEATAAIPAVSTAPAVAELAEPLTPREREVLQRLASGLGNKQIADQLHISEHTVKFHVASILGKLGAATRTEAVALGIRRGLVLL